MQKKKLVIFILLILIVAAAGLVAVKKLRQKNTSTVSIKNEPASENSAHKDNAPNPDSLPALMTEDFQGKNLTLGKILKQNDAYTQYYITYLSQGFKISGIMNVPVGQGPFPVIIANHGFIEPAVYKNGAGIPREDDFFARHGYVVLHSDYRNYADSDIDPENDTKPRSGYTEDVINAVYALKNSELSFINKDQVGMLGHSMGGGVTLNVMVVKPDLVKAYVLLAPINSDYKKNFDRWVAPEMSDIAQKTIAKYGSYEENPELWESFSAKNYFSRIDRPIMLHQGTADTLVPVSWSEDLYNNLQQQGKDIQYFEYPGQNHVMLGADWDQAMQRSLNFFNTNVK